MPAKFCTWPNCTHIVSDDHRYCDRHCDLARAAFRVRRDERERDQARGVAEVATRGND